MAPLFQPFAMKSLRSPNRVAMAPMTRSFSPGGTVTKATVDYYRRRVEGGTGLIITEGVGIDDAGLHSVNVPRFYGPENLAAWRPVVDAVHAAGGAIIPQLWHVGIQKNDFVPDPQAVLGPSGLTGQGEALRPPMTQAQIEATIANFVNAAGAAKDLGFDGIELHGAHGYLIDQFFWAMTNRRDDSFNGGVAERTRFAAELVRECRRKVGPDFAIVLRFSQWKGADYNAIMAKTPAELEALLSPLVDAGVDIFHASTRRFEKPAFEGSNKNLAAWTRKITGQPTIAVGSVTLDLDFRSEPGKISNGSLSLQTLDAVARGITDGDFDMIAVGRSLISNPDWAEKVRSGRAHELNSFERSHLRELV